MVYDVGHLTELGGCWVRCVLAVGVAGAAEERELDGRSSGLESGSSEGCRASIDLDCIDIRI